jgi:hypothetical protein
MPVDFDQVEMREAIDQTRFRDLAKSMKIIRVNLVDVAAGKLFGAGRNAVEHLVGAIEVMDRTENEIELLPIFLDPGAAGRGGFRIVIQLDPGANLDVWIRRAEFVDLIEIDPLMVTIVIRKRDVDQPTVPCAIDPRLQKRLRVRPDAMALRVAVVVGKRLRVNS